VVVSDPWAFGWTQVLTIIGFAITSAIAIGGFRTFNRWKREKLEERRIEVAIEALSLTYKARWVFDTIRSDMSTDPEWKDMPPTPGDTESQRRARGPFFAIMKRIEAQKDFFQRSWELQVLCLAVFGPQAEETFLLLHRARREVEVAAEMLCATRSRRTMTRTIGRLGRSGGVWFGNHSVSSTKRRTVIQWG
jgi:hypothetical protein